MGSFNTYLYSILTVGICAFVCETLVCRTNNSDSLSKGLSLITSICMFLTVISPLFSSLSSINFSDWNYDKNESKTDENVFLELTANETEKEIANQIKNAAGIKKCGVDIKLKTDDDVLTADEIILSVSNDGISKENEIRTAVKNIIGDEIKVIINVSEE